MITDKKIGITGPISEVNFGDYAMLINNIYDISLRDITIFSYNKGFSNLILNDYCESYNINIVDVRLKSIKNEDYNNNDIPSKPKVGFLPFNYPTDTPLDVLYRIDNIEEITRNIEDIDTLIVNGGGYFNHLWNNSLWRSDMLKKIIAPIIIASQKNKKIIFTGNSFGPFDESEEFFNYFFNYLKNEKYAVRDRMYSNVYLSRLNIDKNKINFVPDDLYILNDTLVHLPTHNVVDLSSVGRYIVLETYFPLEEIKYHIDVLKDFSESMYKKYGLSIVFLPFDFQNGGMLQGEYLQSNLTNFYLYDLNKTGYLPIQDAYNIINNAELVICTRYHALVLSVSAGTPVINTIKKVCNDHRYYFNKNYGLLEYTFEGLQFNEMDFIRINFTDTLGHIKDNFSHIIKTQERLYESNQYNKNKEKLKRLRLEYLKSVRE